MLERDTDDIEYYQGFFKLRGDNMKNEKLIALRTAAGLTQNELADKIGVTLRVFQKYESGEVNLNRIAVETAVKLSKALNVSVEELISENS